MTGRLRAYGAAARELGLSARSSRTFRCLGWGPPASHARLAITGRCGGRWRAPRWRPPRVLQAAAEWLRLGRGPAPGSRSGLDARPEPLELGAAFVVVGTRQHERPGVSRPRAAHRGLGPIGLVDRHHHHPRTDGADLVEQPRVGGVAVDHAMAEPPADREGGLGRCRPRSPPRRRAAARPSRSGRPGRSRRRAPRPPAGSPRAAAAAPPRPSAAQTGRPVGPRSG